jgi:hypothetical protein
MISYVFITKKLNSFLFGNNLFKTSFHLTRSLEASNEFRSNGLLFLRNYQKIVKLFVNQKLSVLRFRKFMLFYIIFNFNPNYDFNDFGSFIKT